MKVAVLGPLRVMDDSGAEIEISGARLRSLVARLALDGGRPVAATALIDAVWGESPPTDSANALQTLMSRLRRAAGDAGAVTQSTAGYRLDLSADDVDALRFDRLAADGSAALRSGDATVAAALLSEALGLWRAESLDDLELAGAAGAANAVRLADRRLTATLDLFAARVETGRAAEILTDAESLLIEHPTNERLAGHVMTALAASGRQSDALAAYEKMGRQLADELGVDPSAELQAIHLSILRGEQRTVPGPAVRRHNLRAQLTSFVGRDLEIAAIAKALGDYRLVTLVGPGGSGKTRLANESAASLVDADGDLTTDGAWLVELASVTDPGDIPMTVLAALGLRAALVTDRSGQMSSRDALSRVVESLADRRVVIVLDNCEHLIDAGADFAETVLTSCPGVRILATSREPLNIAGESLIGVSPLGLPRPDATAAEAMEFAAVRLLADRAAAVSPGFTVDDTTIAPVIEIVRRLDGMPLAIELAAARLRSMTAADVAARLDDRFRLLTGGSRTALPRHRTLKAVVEWSWELLSTPERELAERFSVFPSGATGAAVAGVCVGGSVGPDDVDELLTSLVDKSLLQPIAGGRFRMLETIREYAAEALARRDELTELRRAHALFFTEMMREAAPWLITREQLPWMRRIRDERDNILAGLRFWCDVRDPDEALELAVSMSSLAMLLGNHADVSDWVSDALAVPGAVDTDLYTVGEALHALNSATSHVEAALDVDNALAQLRRIKDKLGSVSSESHPMAALMKPAVAMMCEDETLVDEWIEEGLHNSNPWVRASVRMFRANIRDNYGDVVGMREDVEVALTEFHELGERWGLASTLRTAAVINTVEGRLVEARENYDEALALMEEIDSREDKAFLLGRLADLLARLGDLDSAKRMAAEALDFAEQSGSAMEAVVSLGTQMELAHIAGEQDQMQGLYDAAARAYSSIAPGHPIREHLTAMFATAGVLLALDNGEVATALERARAAYPAGVKTRDQPIMALCGARAAAVARALGRPDEGARMLGATAAVRGAEDLTNPSIAELRAQLIADLGAEEFVILYDEGRAMDRDAAIARLDPGVLQI